MTSTAITFRPATQADHSALSNLAALDSQQLSGDRYEVAERDGRIVASVSQADGRAIADPFERTADIVDLLRRHVTPAVRETRLHLSLRRARPVVA
jgi:hypothetical protein